MTDLFAKSLAVIQLPHRTNIHEVQAGHIVINVVNAVNSQAKLKIAEFTRQIIIIANDYIASNFSEQCARNIIEMCRAAISERRNAKCIITFPHSFAPVCDEKLFSSSTQIIFEDCTIRMCAQRFITNQKTEVYT